MAEFVKRSPMPVPASELFEWHKRPGALERLNPPWMPAKVVERRGGISPGSRVVLEVPTGPVTTRWVIEHRDYVEGRQFRDVQLNGPFAKWVHTHLVEPAPGDSSVLEDRVEYELPVSGVGASWIRDSITEVFNYRHEVTAADLLRHRRYPTPPLRILVSGSSGLIGSALVSYLTTAGHDVVRLVRHHAAPDANEASWDPTRGQLNPQVVDGVDVVIHLAGENIGHRWTRERREAIRRSRVESTALIARTIASVSKPPKAFIVASAIGFYGDRAGDLLDENAGGGSGFLADVVRAWESAADPARDRTRVTHLRSGVVLSPEGGALGRLLTPFKAGVGGRIGSGEQFMSWIGLDDYLGAVEHVMHTDSLGGPVNLTAPNPVTNAEFTRVLAHILGRPAAIPVPAFALKLALGEMAEETILFSQRAVPKRLLESGFEFRKPTLESALRFVLGKT